MKKIFIVHGWTYSLDKWDAACRQLQDRGIEPVLLRVPGLTDPSDETWDMPGYVEWLHAALGSESAPIVLGHSNGGRICLAYNQAHPKRIHQLFLLDSAGAYDARLRTRTKLAVLRTVSKIGKLLAFMPIVKKVFYRVIGAHDYANAPIHMKQTMQHMLNADKSIDPSKTTMPTVLIWGKDDTATPLWAGNKLQHAIPHSKLFVIDGARHAPQYTHTAQFVDIICSQIQ